MINGQEMMKVLVRDISDLCFSEFERRFIKTLGGKRYDDLSQHEKAVVQRLYGWWMGGDGGGDAA